MLSPSKLHSLWLQVDESERLTFLESLDPAASESLLSFQRLENEKQQQQQQAPNVGQQYIQKAYSARFQELRDAQPNPLATTRATNTRYAIPGQKEQPK